MDWIGWTVPVKTEYKNPLDPCKKQEPNHPNPQGQDINHRNVNALSHHTNGNGLFDFEETMAFEFGKKKVLFCFVFVFVFVFVFFFYSHNDIDVCGGFNINRICWCVKFLPLNMNRVFAAM